MSELVENYAAHPELVDNLDWYFMPVINPDGYDYTHTTVGFFFWKCYSNYFEKKKFCRTVFGAKPGDRTMEIVSVPI